MSWIKIEKKPKKLMARADTYGLILGFSTVAEEGKNTQKHLMVLPFAQARHKLLDGFSLCLPTDISLWYLYSVVFWSKFLPDLCFPECFFVPHRSGNAYMQSKWMFDHNLCYVSFCGGTLSMLTTSWNFLRMQWVWGTIFLPTINRFSFPFRSIKQFFDLY